MGKTCLCEPDVLMVLVSPYLLEEMVKYTCCDKLASAWAVPPKQEGWVGLPTVEFKLAI